MGSMATALKSAALEMVTSAGGKITALTVGDFKSGAKLYVNGCPITSSDTAVSPNDLTVTIESNNDCHYDAFPNAANGDVVYRRTDDPNNQNVYATSGDVSKESVQGYCTTRGSADIYACAAAGAGVVKKFVKGTNTFTFDAAGSSAADNTIFVNHLGPMRVTSIATTDLVASYAGEAADEFFETFDGATATGMLVYKATAYTDRAAGDILIMDGHRYKVASIGSTPDGTAAKVTLTESYAGGMIYEECLAASLPSTRAESLSLLAAPSPSRSVRASWSRATLTSTRSSLPRLLLARPPPPSPSTRAARTVTLSFTPARASRARPRTCTRSSTAWATSPSRSLRLSAAPPTSMSPSAPTVAPATRPLACASASRA